MAVKELKVKVYLLKDIDKKNCGEKIGDLINGCMLKEPLLQDLHMRKGYKFYCFNYLHPIEYDNIYKANNVYEFNIRGLLYLDEIYNNLKSFRNDHMVVLTIKKLNFTDKKIRSVRNITPMIASVNENGKQRSFNIIDDDENIIKERIFINLVNKYETFYKKNFVVKYEDIFERIELLHKYPIVVQYKDNKMFGYKFKLTYKNTEVAQKYANFSMLVGIGEKNSCIGCGYLILDK